MLDYGKVGAEGKTLFILLSVFLLFDVLSGVKHVLQIVKIQQYVSRANET
jgi:hypothetical protein